MVLGGIYTIELGIRGPHARTSKFLSLDKRWNYSGKNLGQIGWKKNTTDLAGEEALES